MNLTDKDYQAILKYYKINTKKMSKKQIKIKAENIFEFGKTTLLSNKKVVP